MIERIHLLRNIGQFDSVDAGRDIPLAKLTVVYSENGRGKTTIAAVLRSLATGNPLPIAERRRLAAAHPPHAVLECGGDPPTAVFENNAWNRTIPDLVVFDDVFVDENVHSGLAVQSHHRQNLHELILGTQAVALSRRIQGLFERTEDHNRELRARGAAIPAADRGPFSVDEFCALAPRPDIERTILDAERALAAAREQDAIRTTPLFETLDLPAFDLDAMQEILRQDLPSLDAATLRRLQKHFATLGDGGEAWVADGMQRIRREGDTCPLCAQGLRGSPLIEHYRAYFSEAYAALKRSVSETAGRVSRAHDGNAHAGFERAVGVARQRRQFWARFCEVQELALDTAAIARDWRAAGEAVVAQLNAKQAAPLERMQVSDDTRARVDAYRRHRETIAEINRGLRDANAAIGVAKERAAVADSAVLEADLAALRAVRARHDPGTAALCDAYLAERAAKEETERQREQARTELEAHRTRVFPGYQAAINIHLQRFNAGFRLDSVNYANTRGGPTCTYNVLINNQRVPVGAEDAPGEPTFRSTLSAGDRNTLALAFFFASLEQDPDLAAKVVVIDDPISSLDDHRALTTVQEVRRLAERAAQVIVLSHNKPFLCRLWEGTDATLRAALEVVREAAGSTLRSWDVSHDTVTEHDRRHGRLLEYASGGGGGDLREVARSIRPHLEAFLRVARPGEFPPGTLLGPFLNVCEQRLGTLEEVMDAAAVEELRTLVEYANRFHHDTNAAWETEAINDGELFGFVDRTLRFARP